MSEALPQFILQTPDYDPENPDHVRRWELAGRPDMDQIDQDGHHWRPTITAELQPDGKTYLPILAPEVDATVTKVQEMQRNRTTASIKTDTIKTRILSALEESGMTEEQGKSVGIAVISSHSTALLTFEMGGGGATATKFLYDDLKSDDRLKPFLNIIEEVLGIKS